MMTSLLTPQRYMVTIAIRAPGCRQPSRYRWHASRPSWVGLRTERVDKLFLSLLLYRPLNSGINSMLRVRRRLHLISQLVTVRETDSLLTAQTYQKKTPVIPSTRFV